MHMCLLLLKGQYKDRFKIALCLLHVRVLSAWRNFNEDPGLTF